MPTSSSPNPLSQLELTVDHAPVVIDTRKVPPAKAPPAGLANQLWGCLLAEAAARLGITYAVISPGSRSTPLTYALVKHPQITAVPVLDERSAGFHALGLARASGRPVILVCTSGSAGAHYYPALIEASEAQVPLLVLTADRPDELRHCRSGQTIDQTRLFGTYVRWSAEARDPEASQEALRAWRNLLVFAVERCQFPVAGPVHLNVPFRDPLEPSNDAASLCEGFEHLLEHLQPTPPVTLSAPAPELSGSGLIIAGPAQPTDVEGYVAALRLLAEKTNWPILADALNPARHYAEQVPNLVVGYDLILRNSPLPNAYQPQQIVQLGDLPTSKTLRRWLHQAHLPTVVVDDRDVNADASHARTRYHRSSVPAFAEALTRNLRMDLAFTTRWQRADRLARQYLRDNLRSLSWLFEGNIPRAIAEAVPDATPIYVASSTPVRDFEWFWPVGDRRRRIFFNRGANGIDGTISTALGIAAALQKPTILHSGDLALLHDTNGLLLAASTHLRVGLTIICTNNAGGGIFEHLPIARQADVFEDFWATPQVVDLGKLAAAYGIAHELIDDVETLRSRLETLPTRGVRLLELRTERKRDAAFRQQLFAGFALPGEVGT